MSIEIPDWVVEAALRGSFHVVCKHEGIEFSEEEFANARNDADLENRKVAAEMMKAALSAALEGWLVAKPVQWEPSGTERVFIPEAPTATPNAAPVSMLGRWETTYYWRAPLGGATKDGNPPSEPLYTLRKDKTP